MIYFDDGKWDYVLNHHYLPTSPDDERPTRNTLPAAALLTAFEF